MTSAVFVPRTAAAPWTDEVLPGLSPAELPVAGRPFVDYALEAAGRFGVDFADTWDARWSPRLAVRLGERLTGQRDGLCDIAYNRIREVPRGLRDLERTATFREQSGKGPVIVLWGLALPLYQPGETSYVPVTEKETLLTPVGVYHFDGDRWLRPSVRPFAVNDTASWLELSLWLLSGSGAYTLPGYSAEKGVRICRNVVTERGVRIEPPALLCDDSWCARNARLRRVVVGRGAFVGEAARLSNTVVGDETMVGEGLELNGKIVMGGRVIDAATGTWVDVEDDGMASRVRRAPAWMRAIGRFLAGASRERRP